MVFHSPETFVHTGAVFKSELLILGRTGQSIQENAAQRRPAPTSCGLDRPMPTSMLFHVRHLPLRLDVVIQVRAHRR
jgi:hypothetical protein